MNHSPGIPVFGDKLVGQTYIERSGVYAVIRDARHRIAALRVGTVFFLPGGGSEPGETPQGTLHREMMEECGCAIRILTELGQATEYIYARNEGVYYQIRSTFFEAMFIDSQVQHVTDDHMLVWLSAAEAIRSLQRQSQAWAVGQLFNGTNGFPGTSRESGR